MARTLARLAAWPLVSGQSASGGSMSRVAEGHFRKETRRALDIEGKHVTIQGPSPERSPAAAYAPSACTASAPSLLIRRNGRTVQNRPHLGLAQTPGAHARRRCSDGV